MKTAHYRETKYCSAVRQAIADLGHATNSQLLERLRYAYPELTATTVHRVTSRLYGRGEIGIAPPNARGAVRYDALAQPHDHFNCSACDRLCDTNIKEKIYPIINAAIEDCSISGNIVITGICTDCSA